MSGGVFICYRREDSAFAARAICDRLAACLQRENVFFDVDNIDLGLDWVKVLSRRIGECDALVAIIGKSWISRADNSNQRRLDNIDDPVRVEIAAALKRRILVIPVMVEGAAMPKRDDLPADLKDFANRNGLVISHPRFDADIENLTSRLSSLLEERRRNDAKRAEREERKRHAATARSARERRQAARRAEAERRAQKPPRPNAQRAGNSKLRRQLKPNPHAKSASDEWRPQRQREKGGRPRSRRLGVSESDASCGKPGG
jgi:TIR domain